MKRFFNTCRLGIGKLQEPISRMNYRVDNDKELRYSNSYSAPVIIWCWMNLFPDWMWEIFMNVRKSFNLINDSHELNTIIFSTHDIELAVELADSLYVVGYGKNENGTLSSTGTLLKHYDLKLLGLAWQAEFGNDHLELAKEIKAIMLQS